MAAQQSTPAGEPLYRKSDVAYILGISERSISAWIARGWLAKPMKRGTSQQAPVRWTAADIAIAKAKLAEFRDPAPASGAAAA